MLTDVVIDSFLTCKSGRAQLTLVQSVPGVSTNVLVQVTLLTKRYTANVAGIRLFASVNAKM